MPTQREQILEYLQKGFTITPIQALNLFGCFRLSAVVHTLRRQGHRIESKTVQNKNSFGVTKHFAEYRLVKPDHLF